MQSTLILSRTDGSIIQSTGLLASSSALPDDVQADRTSSNGTAHNDNSLSQDYIGEVKGRATGKSAEDTAKMVFSFVKGANVFADEIQEGDEVKLLRIRTKRTEIVIVPGKKFSTFKFLRNESSAKREVLKLLLPASVHNMIHEAC